MSNLNMKKNTRYAVFLGLLGAILFAAIAGCGEDPDPVPAPKNTEITNASANAFTSVHSIWVDIGTGETGQTWSIGQIRPRGQTGPRNNNDLLFLVCCGIFVLLLPINIIRKWLAELDRNYAEFGPRFDTYSKEKLVTVTWFVHLVDAQGVWLKLRSENIEAYLADDYTVLNNPLWSMALGGVKVLVKQSDAERARQILKEQAGKKPEIEIGNKTILKTAHTCPRCGSADIYRETTLNYSIPGIILFYFWRHPFLFQSEGMFCFNCKNHWDHRTKEIAAEKRAKAR